MRRLAVIALLLWTALVPGMAGAAAPSVIEARAWLLMDATTGRILMAHEGDTPLPIASTTKIMTAILSLERGDLADVVTVGQKPYDTGGSTIFLEVGEQQSLEHLLYALMLESANDAAVAIAEHLAGTEERFVAWMNAKAQALGLAQTHFVNSHGLHDPAHYATARDLALLARYAMQNPAFRALVATAEKEIPGAPGNPPRRLINHNRLLGYYEGANGVKNGFTEEALLTNVASARRGQTELIAVVLGAEQKLWTSSMALLDFGFAQYETRQLAARGAVRPLEIAGVGTVEVAYADDLWATLRREPAMPRSEVVSLLPDLALPVAAGAPVATVRFLQGDQVVAEGRLLATRPIAPARPAPEPEEATSRAQPGPAVPPWLWVVAWLWASVMLTQHLHRFRTP